MKRIQAIEHQVKVFITRRKDYDKDEKFIDRVMDSLSHYGYPVIEAQAAQQHVLTVELNDDHTVETMIEIINRVK
jgi:hypothetical protein